MDTLASGSERSPVKAICLPPTAHTPEISFDPLRQRVDIRGHCQTQRIELLFEPLMLSLRHNFAERQPLLFTLHLALDDVDKAGLRALRDLCCLVDAEGRAGRWIEVIWSAEPDDSAHIDLGTALLDGLHHVQYSIQDARLS
jgi:hypothetical protein